MEVMEIMDLQSSIIVTNSNPLHSLLCVYNSISKYWLTSYYFIKSDSYISVSTLTLF